MGAMFDVMHIAVTAFVVILTFVATHHWSTKKNKLLEAKFRAGSGEGRLSRSDQHAGPESSAKVTKDYLTCRIRGVPLDWNEDDLATCIGTSAHVESLATEIDGRTRTGTATFPRDYPQRISINASLGEYLTIDQDFLGITTLNAPDHPKVDLIAVSGLGGHAFGSFKERDGDHMWLRDSLPRDLLDPKTKRPMARIMTYGHSSHLAASHSMQELEDISTSFRDSILHLAATPRPIVLIGHSLGGLIIKKALVSLLSSAPKNQREYECLARAVCGIIFLGVPHDGMEIDALRRVVGDNLNRSLIDSLGSKNSSVLTDLRRDFNRLLDLHPKVETFCFFETEESSTLRQDQSGKLTMDGPRTVLVTKASATHCRASEYDSQHQSAIARSHSEMVKYGRHDHEYDKVKVKLQLVAQRAIATDSALNLSLEAVACLSDLFVTDPFEDKQALRRKKGDRVAGTCEWILDTEDLNAWLNAGQTKFSGSQTTGGGVLWLHGNPGTGKSTLAIFLTDELSNRFSAADGETLAYFFCDSAFDTRKTATSIIRGLLLQLLKQHPRLYSYVLPKYHEQKAKLFESFDTLWTIFILAAADDNTGRKYCIIDALDECDEESQKMLLQQLQKTFQGPDAPPNVCILITSRPYPEIGEFLDTFVNKDLAAFPEAMHDINLCIEEKVAELTKRKKYTDKVKREVSDILRCRAEGTFLWVGIVCQELENIPSKNAVSQLKAMPSGLHSLYEKLFVLALEREPTRDTIRLILSLVAVSQRPLNLLELSEASRLYLDEDDLETRMRFMRDDIESCRLMVVIQDRKVLLLHQSVKDFLSQVSEGTGFSEFKAHARLAYRCIDCLIQDFHNGEPKHHYFSEYATLEWPNHARMAQPEFDVIASQLEFFDIVSPCRDFWLKNHRRIPTYNPLPKRFSILHIAARWGIPTIANHVFHLEDQQYNAKALIHDVDEHGWTPLEHAAMSKHPNIVPIFLDHGATIKQHVIVAAAGNSDSGEELIALLLDRQGDKITITDKVVRAAAGNNKEVIALLLDRRGSEITITDKVVQAAAGNRYSGEDVMALLLDRRGDEITITDKVVRAAARNSKEVIALLLDRRGSEIMITDKVVQAAAGNENSGKEVMALLLDRRGNNITITDKVMRAAARNNEQVIALLLDRRGSEITITDKVVRAAAGNRDSGKEVMAMLLDRRGDEITITDEVVQAAAGNENSGKEVMSLLLDRRGSEITITDKVVKAAAGSWNSGGVIALLLDRRGDEITITDEVLQAAVGNENSGKEVMALLLDRRGDEIAITDEVVEAAAGNSESGEEVISLLLDRRGDEITITDEVMDAAAGNWNSGEEIIALLLDRRGNEITIADEVVTTIAKQLSEKVMALLLDRQGDKITITDEVVEAAAGNRNSGKEVMAMLLDRRGSEITITDKVVRAAARNNEEVIALLLDRRGSEITITDKVVRAAAGNWNSGKAVIAMLLDRRGDEITITDELVRTAARNNEEVIALLLDRRGSEITITDKVVQAAAGNWNSGRVIALLLDRRGDEITITDEVVQAAAGNENSGKEVMSLLLDRRGDEIAITDEVVEAAAGNSESGEEVMALLLKRRGDEITITDKVVRAAVGNKDSGKEVIALLLERRGNEMTISDEVVTTIAKQFNEKVMALLLDRRGDKITITDEVVQAAAENENSGKEVMSLLLDRRGDEITITDEVVEVAAGNSDSGEEVMSLLLDRRGDEITITDEVVEAAAGNSDSGEEVMSLLLKRRGDEITITDKVVQAAAVNWDSGEEIIALLLDRRGNEITIADTVITAIAKQFNEKVMALLLEQRGNKITITNEVVEAAAGNSYSGEEVMALLLKRRGNKIMITDKVVQAAAGNWNSGKKVMVLLLDRRGSEITITDKVVRAAAGNCFSGKAIIAMLLDRRGSEVTITDKVVRAAAGNNEEVITLLLDQRGSEITITDEVVRAAAENRFWGKEVMALLLDRRGDDITITDEVVEAAAGNWNSGKKVMSLLLDRRGDEITITDKVVEAAAKNGISGEEVMALLLERRGSETSVAMRSRSRIRLLKRRRAMRRTAIKYWHPPLSNVRKRLQPQLQR
ncbi:hypothetical protein QQS21_010748 [Conoideocrella luteorostrata]|uniref:NACHT domain-containing protein n=1 Tax=Conoideocrella luteorostrata TaxID=1105319 RepID=A0AAJ0FWJ0_9HYPO|nr:hypothetical protein QQS21_010748 [Conoideocrella luteorostrata]